MPPRRRKKGAKGIPPTIPEGDLEVPREEIPTAEDEDWANSEARRLLYEDLKNGTVPDVPDASFPTNLIFTSRPEFAATGYRLFPSRLSSLRKIYRKDKGRADADLKLFNEFKENNAIHSHSARGWPEWDGSVAQKQLKQDIQDGILDTLTPAELWCLRPVYDDYPLKVFRDHIYQEDRTKKFLHTLKVKGKSKMKPGRS